MKHINTTISTILCLVLAAFSHQVMAQTKIDTINANNHKLNINRLKPSKQTYLVYFTDSSKTNRRGIGDLWERTITYVNSNQKEFIQFDWKWISADGIIKQTTNLCDPVTFAPISHYGINKTPKGMDTIAYLYDNGYVFKDKSVTGNKVKDDFQVKLDIPILSWELDLETYPLLPIKKVGQVFDIAFFDLFEPAPTYHRYTVVGEEKLTVFEGIRMPCWLLKIDYDKKNSAVFWISKKTGELIKSEEKVATRKGFIYSIKIKQVD